MLRLARLDLPLAVMLFLTATYSVSQTAALQQEKRAAAITLEQQGRLAEAEIAWRDVLRMRPSDADAYAHLGLLEARQERYKEAISLYRKALANNPAMPGLRLNLGLAQFKSGELKESIQTFTDRKSTRLNSSHANISYAVFCL